MAWKSDEIGWRRTLENPQKTDPVARTSAQAFLARQDSFEKALKALETLKK